MVSVGNIMYFCLIKMQTKTVGIHLLSVLHTFLPHLGIRYHYEMNLTAVVNLKGTVCSVHRCYLDSIGI